MNAGEQTEDHRRDKRLFGCMAMMAVGPVVLCACLLSVYWYCNRPTHVIVPTHSVPANNAFDDWVTAGKMLRGASHTYPCPDYQPSRDYTFANFQACYDESRPALAIFRRGLGKTYVHPAIRSWDDTFPHFSYMRDVGHVISAEAGYYQCLGQYGKALDSRLDGMELGAKMGKGAPLIGPITGIACMAISRHNLEDMIPRLTRTDLARAATRLDSIEAMMIPYSEAILEEGYVQVASVQELPRHGKNLIDELEPYYWPAQSGSWEMKWRRQRYAFTNKQKMLESQLAYYNRLSTEAKKPFTGVSPVSVSGDEFADILCPYFGKSRVRFEAEKAAVRILRIEVALRRYYLDNGCHPAALSALVPRYTGSIPPDPFGGKPFVYRASLPNKYALYSVGVNLRDDRGTVGKKLRDPNADIVAGLLEGAEAKPIQVKGAPVSTQLCDAQLSSGP